MGETIFCAVEAMKEGDTKIGVDAGGVVAGDIGRRSGD